MHLKTNLSSTQQDLRETMFIICILLQIVSALHFCPSAKISCSHQEAAVVPSMSPCTQSSLGTFYTVKKRELSLAIEHHLLFAFAAAAGNCSYVEADPVFLVVHSSCWFYRENCLTVHSRNVFLKQWTVFCALWRRAGNALLCQLSACAALEVYRLWYAVLKFKQQY